MLPEVSSAHRPLYPNQTQATTSFELAPNQRTGANSPDQIFERNNGLCGSFCSDHSSSQNLLMQNEYQTNTYTLTMKEATKMSKNSQDWFQGPTLNVDQLIEDCIQKDINGSVFQNSEEIHKNLLPVACKDNRNSALKFENEVHMTYAACQKATPAWFEDQDQPSQKQLDKWSQQEHEKFLKGLRKFGKDWSKISAYIQTRDFTQVRSHAQKFFNKMERRGQYPTVEKSSLLNKKKATTLEDFKRNIELQLESKKNRRVRKDREKPRHVMARQIELERLEVEVILEINQRYQCIKHGTSQKQIKSSNHYESGLCQSTTELIPLSEKLRRCTRLNSLEKELRAQPTLQSHQSTPELQKRHQMECQKNGYTGGFTLLPRQNEERQIFKIQKSQQPNSEVKFQRQPNFEFIQFCSETGAFTLPAINESQFFPMEALNYRTVNLSKNLCPSPVACPSGTFTPTIECFQNELDVWGHPQNQFSAFDTQASFFCQSPANAMPISRLYPGISAQNSGLMGAPLSYPRLQSDIYGLQEFTDVDLA